MTDSEFKANMLREYAELKANMKAEMNSLRKQLDKAIADHDGLQDKIASLPEKISDQTEKIVNRGNGRVYWVIGGLTVIAMAVFGWLASDIDSHEKLDAHPVASKNMAKVQVMVENNQKAADRNAERIVRVVEDSNKMIREMMERNGREN